ncbi:MAG: U32 family peptidase [Rhizobiales bacterium]|nr:U32 family peptidase [Hyphomicrobiales bacterium]MBI3672624.1 U32 family peptidase [Hyphomicrobiales bacterium]
MPPSIRPELVCPAGTPGGLRTAVEAGADAVYCGFQDATNARNFPGLNFTRKEMDASIAWAHERGAKVLVALNTFPPAGQTQLWKTAVDDAAHFGADAIIVADIGVARYAAKHHADLRLHLSVQAGASSPEAIRFYCETFGVRRVVLPRMLTVAEIKSLHDEIPCEIEAFVFGNIGMMAEGRCSLTNYVTGISTNMDGVCSPAAQVVFEEDDARTLTARMGGFTMDRFACGEAAGYPTICKGRYTAGGGKPYYAFEEPVSLNLSALLPDLVNAGVTAFKIEGRQRSRAYVREIVSAYRKAVDQCMAGETPHLADLLALAEGHRQTQGAFASKKWR